jgi:hypothetical protein
MKKKYFSRRLLVGGFLVTAVSFYAAAIAGGALRSCRTGGFDDQFGGLHPLIRIGNAYLDEMSKSGELRTLYKELFGDRRMTSTELAGIIQGRLSTAGFQAQEEFKSGETVLCDGWVLAKSEARLCAMIAIRAQRLNVS